VGSLARRGVERIIAASVAEAVGVGDSIVQPRLHPNLRQAMRITIITTGGTISKTFNEHEGMLRNEQPVVERIVDAMRLPDLTVTYRHILSKDSLEFTDEDRQLVVASVREARADCEAIVVSHGTDTLATTGELLHREVGELGIPILLTGAMRPFEFRDTDAIQNLTETLLACRLVPPGVYVAMHNRVLRFPGVVKDREALAFVRST
jgi:L-asparaginase